MGHQRERDLPSVLLRTFEGLTKTIIESSVMISNVRARSVQCCCRRLYE